MNQQPNPYHSRVARLHKDLQTLYAGLADLYEFSSKTQNAFWLFYISLPWGETIHTLRAWPGIGQLILIVEWYVHAIIELGFVLGNDIRKIRQWSYPKKMIVLYTLVFFGTLFFSPIPPRSPAPMLAVVFAGGIGTVYLFSRWLQDWANNGFTRT